MSHPRLSLQTKYSSAENAKALFDPNASFTLIYWDVASVGASARDMLSLGKVQWKDRHPTDEEWGGGKLPTPFGVMPVLEVHSSDGKTIPLTESIAVDLFLAKRFHLLGDNEWEEATIKGFYSNIHYLRERSFMTVTWTHSSLRKTALDNFIGKTLPQFIADHEFHLRENGSNGHYVGDKISLADIHLSNIIDHFSYLPSGDVMKGLFNESDLLCKVKTKVDAHPEIAAWRASAPWNTLARATVKVYECTAPPSEE
ncbi:Glutathione S-transferase S1 [Haplosporangium bisporale]|nr:Glutathione S-transferase S1 [Haplosporangium bisporale]